MTARNWKIPLTAIAAVVGASALATSLGTAGASTRVHGATTSPPHLLTAHSLRPRTGAIRPGTNVSPRRLFGDRVFANSQVGFALAGESQAQYPARTLDGGRTWQIDGPQVHVDAADAPEAVGFVGVAGPRTFFAYGSSAVDVTTDGGRTWWETLLGELVMAVVPGTGHDLIAYVQQSLNNGSNRPAVTWQYVSRDGGRHWHYSTALGGLP
jgi:hypothetical protein